MKQKKNFFCIVFLFLSLLTTLSAQSSVVPDSKTFFTGYNILIIIFSVLFVVGIALFFFFSFDGAFREKRVFKKEMSSLLTGSRMPFSFRNRSFFHNRQPKLRNKLILFSFSLVFTITVLGASIIGLRVVKLHKKTLANSLKDRIDIVQTSILSKIKSYMPMEEYVEIEEACSLIKALPEVNYITVLGPKAGKFNPNEFDYLWYSSDPAISSKIDDMKGYGNTKFISKEMNIINSYIQNMNENVMFQTGAILRHLDRQELQLQRFISEDSKILPYDLNVYQTDYLELAERFDVILIELSRKYAFSFPSFNTENLNLDYDDYSYCMPIFYREHGSEQIFHGMILVNFSTKILKNQLQNEIRKINSMSVGLSVLSVFITVIASYILATIVTNPIKELEIHLKKVGFVKDRTKLDKMEIRLASNDEIGRLGTIVNEMTRQLASAAKEEKLIVDAKDVQQAFLPLVVSESGIKSNIARQKTEVMDFFGYFEGATTVSGDFFDFKRLDKDWFVFVKCDASGHGFSAAIIMTIIATLFRSYFTGWSFEKNGIGINHFVNQVNQFIASLDLEGKFASLIICLLNSKTGELYMCNAGDNLLHIYDSTIHKVKTIELFSSPVIGPFNPVLINQMGGFKVEKIILKPGDILFLYTDGIEESTRYCRTPGFEIKQVYDDNPDKMKYKTETLGQRNILRIIEAVLNKDIFVLEKIDNPNVGESLEFDFTNCLGTTEDVVLAVIAVEKVFRMYKPLSAEKTDYITVDKQIDRFLKKYFNKYNDYCLSKADSSEEFVFSNYVDYEYMMEDEQKDDLTLLAIKYR